MVSLHITEKLSQLSIMNITTKQGQTNLQNSTESLLIPLESFCCEEISAVRARWRVLPSQSITVPSKILHKFSAVLYPYGTGSNLELTQEKLTPVGTHPSRAFVPLQLTTRLNPTVLPMLPCSGAGGDSTRGALGPTQHLCTTQPRAPLAA